MRKKCLANDGCPLSRGYGAVGDAWSLVIVARVLLGGLRRFGEIQGNLGLARNILTARLKKLVDEGILKKVPAADGSTYQEYAPTAKGRDLFTVVVALRQWGDAHCPPPAGGGQCGQMVDRFGGKPLPPVEVRSAGGRVLGPEDLWVAGTVEAVPEVCGTGSVRPVRGSGRP